MNKHKIFLFILIIFSHLSDLLCSDITSCHEEFTVESQEGTVVSFTKISSNISVLVVNVSEIVRTGKDLHKIMWTDNVFPGYEINSNVSTVLQYDLLSYSVNNLTVIVDNSMREITDYNNPNRQEHLEIDLNFDFPNIPDRPCKINVRHDLQDENTQRPYFEDDLYQVVLGEEFPSLTIIPALQPLAYDFDATPPNNVFVVETSSDCPLEASDPSYTCVGGAPVILSFSLKHALDYEAMVSPYQYNCSVRLKDLGYPFKVTESTITILVTPFPDEDPVFSLNFYKGSLEDSVEGTIVAVEVSATDPDVPSSNVIIYSMTSADNTVRENDFFSMNNSTGEITVIKNISNDLLSWKFANFILTACDGDNQCGHSLLFIQLPSQSSPDLGSLDFERNYYSCSIVSPYLGEFIIKIYSQSSNNQEDVRYYFVDDGSPGLQYFDIDEITGQITTTQIDTLPRSYVLIANATDGFLLAKTRIYIQILLRLPEDAIIMESIVFTSAVDGFYPTELYTVTGVGVNFFCILSVQPLDYFGSFTITETGTIFLTKTIDADDPTLENSVSIKAASYSRDTKCIQSAANNRVQSNEILIELEILDYNDNIPYFVDGNEILYAFPLEVALQKAIGLVATVKAQDNDVDHNLRYGKMPYFPIPSDVFVIDPLTGEIFLTGEMIPAKFYVSVTDSDFVIFSLVQIDVLTTDYISTIYFYNMTMGEIKNRISEMAASSKIKLYLLYTNVIQPEDDVRTVEAHVYGTSGMELLNNQNIKKVFELANIDMHVLPFSDKKLYTKEPNDSYKAASIALGCISGVLLLLIVAFLVRTICSK